MFSSPFLLSLSTVLALIGLTLVIIAGFSDNWLEFQVSRSFIIDTINHNSKLDIQLKESTRKDVLYFSRTYGLTNICFTENVPADIGSISKFGSPCIWNKDYLPSNVVYECYNSIQKIRMWLMRSQITFYAFGLCLVIISLLTGFIGCYKRSVNIIKTTTFILFFADIFLIVSFLIWNFIYYQEVELLVIYPFYKSWNPFLKNATKSNYGWSYFTCIVALIFISIAIFTLNFSKNAIKKEENQLYENKHAIYYQQYYNKSLVPVSYGTPYSKNYGIYTFPSAAHSTFYSTHPSYGFPNYYNYMAYGA